MKLSDMKESFREFWKEFSKVKFGMVGLGFFGFFLFLFIFEPFIVPFPQAGSEWRDITYWEDNPQSAPPVWVNYFSAKKSALSTQLINPAVDEKKAGAIRIVEETFTYNYNWDIPPSDMIIHFAGSGNPMIDLSLERPDGQKVSLFKKTAMVNPKSGLRISIDKNAQSSAYNFGIKFDENGSSKVNPNLVRPMRVLFSKADENIFGAAEPLKGTYRIKAMLILQNPDATITNAYVNVAGSVSGILGTDNSKRDLWSGIVAGVKWALLIGLLTAFVSVWIGVVYGIMSAYLGGWKDALLQRIFEIFVSVPVLPLLIVMSAVFKPSIWNLIFIMIVFFWTGPVKTVRSIGLQIKEETYIEASKALGAKNSRIIFKHMVPLLIPYSFASMALFIPGAIVYEASISLLGLGDTTIVTWGQILHDALGGGAVLNGLWWWVIPPGFAIAIMGMTFAFIGFAMDRILHPKLRTR